MKISSTTHMTILFSFALAFVVVYLYTTITDVRKMSAELKKVTTDVQSLATAVSKLNNEVNDVQKIGMDVNNMLASELQKCCVMPQVQVCEQKQPEVQDDAQSVDTVDIKKMLNDEDDDEEPAPAQDTVLETETAPAPPPVPAKKPSTRKKST